MGKQPPLKLKSELFGIYSSAFHAESLVMERCLEPFKDFLCRSQSCPRVAASISSIPQTSDQHRDEQSMPHFSSFHLLCVFFVYLFHCEGILRSVYTIHRRHLNTWTTSIRALFYVVLGQNYEEKQSRINGPPPNTNNTLNETHIS